MSKDTDTGGYAFPLPQGLNGYDYRYDYRQEGMTLRDWFAGKALAGMNATLVHDTDWPRSEAVKCMAERAYMQADAMIAERNKS